MLYKAQALKTLSIPVNHHRTVCSLKINFDITCALILLLKGQEGERPGSEKHLVQ